MQDCLLRAARFVALPVVLSACAANVPVKAVELAPLAAPVAELQVASATPVLLPTGYTRTVPERSRWRAAGTLPEGIVYEPLDTVFAIEGRHVHEAWLVVRDGAIRGFYLPAENNYSPLPQPVSLPQITGARR